ncbi:MAG TPA: hypothetical protein VFL82_02240 [Thermomicrobiales bacterium]|nr:hypothetical protein [Thermomicrobiales bacterium]
MTRTTTKAIRPGRYIALIALAAAIFGLMSYLLFPLSIAAQTPVPSTLQGDYTIGINKDDVPKDLAGGPSLIGQWRVSFAADGSYHMDRLDVGTLVTGTFTVQGNQITITDTGGLMSCSNADAATGDQGDVSTGTYEFTQSEKRLSLTPKDDGCASRKLILGTRELVQYVECLTPASSEVPGATPVAGTPEATLGLLQPAAQSTPESQQPRGAPPSGAGAGNLDKAIDNVLDQMTACWATGDPSRFLPLLSKDYEAALRGQFPSEEEFTNNFQAAMQSPIVFTRVGEVTSVDATHATANVRTENGEATTARFGFILEDGAWKWAGPV